MNELMTKYINAYSTAEGCETQKVKHILMFYSHQWDWTSQGALIADLIDDQNITAGDIIEFLENTYAAEGGNKEFSSAIKAMKLCLQKAKMHGAKALNKDYLNALEDISGNEEDLESNNSFVPNFTDFLKHQTLSH
jgi:hypothetical protein